MPAEKLSISFPEALAARIDALAAADGVSRSWLIQEAAAQYVTSREAADRATRRRAGASAALAGFERIAQAWGPDDRLGVQYLDDLRGENDSTGGSADTTGQRDANRE